MNAAIQYAYSLDEEHYHGSYDSPELAAWQGLHERLADQDDESPCVWVGEIRPPDMHCPFDGHGAIDQLHGTDDFDNEWSENFCPTQTEIDDLTKRLQEAWNGWLEANKIDPGFFTVSNAREWCCVFHKPYNPDGECTITECGVLEMVSKQSPNPPSA